MDQTKSPVRTRTRKTKKSPRADADGHHHHGQQAASPAPAPPTATTTAGTKLASPKGGKEVSPGSNNEEGLTSKRNADDSRASTTDPTKTKRARFEQDDDRHPNTLEGITDDQRDLAAALEEIASMKMSMIAINKLLSDQKSSPPSTRSFAEETPTFPNFVPSISQNARVQNMVNLVKLPTHIKTSDLGVPLYREWRTKVCEALRSNETTLGYKVQTFAHVVLNYLDNESLHKLLSNCRELRFLATRQRSTDNLGEILLGGSSSPLKWEELMLILDRSYYPLQPSEWLELQSKIAIPRANTDYDINAYVTSHKIARSECDDITKQRVEAKWSVDETVKPLPREFAKAMVDPMKSKYPRLYKTWNSYIALFKSASYQDANKNSPDDVFELLYKHIIVDTDAQKTMGLKGYETDYVSRSKLCSSCSSNLSDPGKLSKKAKRAALAKKEHDADKKKPPKKADPKKPHGVFACLFCKVDTHRLDECRKWVSAKFPPQVHPVTKVVYKNASEASVLMFRPDPILPRQKKKNSKLLQYCTLVSQQRREQGISSDEDDATPDSSKKL